ncbi:MAG TPA: hypothetical protein VF875_16140 [Anaeromyxobacter sp.]
MRSCRTGVVAIAVALTIAPALASAHETLHEVRRGSAISVKAFESDGDPLDDRPYEIFSPADPRTPWQRGHTDRAGWLAFVPDVAGRWRVKVFEEGGHGLDLEIDASAPAVAGAPSAGGGAVATAAFVLRPVVGIAIIGAVFAALVLVYRRKRSDR